MSMTTKEQVLSVLDSKLRTFAEGGERETEEMGIMGMKKVLVKDTLIHQRQVQILETIRKEVVEDVD